MPNQRHRRSVLKLLLVISVIFGIFFSLLNWETNTRLAIIELMLALYSIVLLSFVLKNKPQFVASLSFLIPLYSIMLYGLSCSKSAETTYVWILVIPVLSHLLLGRWLGLVLSIIFMSIGFILFIQRFHYDNNILNLQATSNVILAGLSVLILSHIYEVTRIRSHRKLLHLAMTDSLTSLANRTQFLNVFERERNHAIRNNSDLSLLLLDLDHFKQVNDNHGHDVGDEVLKYVSATISHRLRKTDLACRLGGEEFGVLLPGASLERAMIIAETIRKNIADVPYARGDKLITLSVSIGAAEYGPDGRDLESLYAIADGHMYRAKTMGRNRILSREVIRNSELGSVLVD